MDKRIAACIKVIFLVIICTVATIYANETVYSTIVGAVFTALAQDLLK